jgi:hypothetical protein
MATLAAARSELERRARLLASSVEHGKVAVTAVQGDLVTVKACSESDGWHRPLTGERKNGQTQVLGKRQGDGNGGTQTSAKRPG